MVRFLLCALLCLLAVPVAAQNNSRLIYDNTTAGGPSNQDVKPAFPLPVIVAPGTAALPLNQYSKVFGTTTWVKTTSAQTGSSKNLLAANDNRTGFLVYNPTGNATIFVDLSGGTVASETGFPVVAGTYFGLLGVTSPKTAITVIGTNTQNVFVWEGQ
jgi:hypothetical protein